MQKMAMSECKGFLLDRARTAKLATVRADNRPHVVPVWFDLDGDDLIFTTWQEWVKASNIARNPRVCICVDSEAPPFAYVQVEGTAETSNNPDELSYWARRIAGRYIGEEQVEAYASRNSVEGELAVRVRPSKIIGQKDVAGW